MNKVDLYLKTEKELSQSNIAKLEKINKPYSIRLIKKELQFVHFDFSKYDIHTLDEVRDAVKLFKISKAEFLKKYSNEEIEFKNIFLKIKKYADNMSIINGVIDNYHFPSIADKATKKDSDVIKKTVLKRFLFLKFLLYSSAEVFVEQKCNVNDIINNVYKYLFFNEKILENFDDLESELILLQIEKYENISKKINNIYHKTNETDFLVFDINRVGNEKVNSLYINILKNNGEEIILKGNKMFNYPINNKYFKSIKIKGGQINSIDEIDIENSIIICSMSRREMEHTQENIMWLKFTLDKLINS